MLFLFTLVMVFFVIVFILPLQTFLSFNLETLLSLAFFFVSVNIFKLFQKAVRKTINFEAFFCIIVCIQNTVKLSKSRLNRYNNLIQRLTSCNTHFKSLSKFIGWYFVMSVFFQHPVSQKPERTFHMNSLDINALWITL